MARQRKLGQFYAEVRQSKPNPHTIRFNYSFIMRHSWCKSTLSSSYNRRHAKVADYQISQRVTFLHRSLIRIIVEVRGAFRYFDTYQAAWHFVTPSNQQTCHFTFKYYSLNNEYLYYIECIKQYCLLIWYCVISKVLV